MEFIVRPFTVVLVLAALALTGCQRSDSPSCCPLPPADATVSPQQFSEVHWLGRQLLTNDPLATNFVALWQLPESARLETQTLTKLAQAPWRMLWSDDAVSDAPVDRLRPLLEDLVAAETHLRFYHPSNRLAAFQLSVRLADGPAALWQSNLAAVCESLFQRQPEMASSGQGWSLAGVTLATNGDTAARLQGTWKLELTHTNGWTRWTVARTTDRAPYPPSSIFHPPSTSGETNWLTTDLDLAWLMPALGAPVPPACGWPRLTLTATGDGENVRTRAVLDFPQPLGAVLSPWNLPTNLINEPLVGFTATREVRPLLSWLSPSGVADLLPLPDQFFAWGQDPMPMQTYFAIPFNGASNWLQTLVTQRLDHVNTWLKTNSEGAWVHHAERSALAWQDLPYFLPHLRTTTLPGGEFLTGGFVPALRTNRPAPVELIAQVTGPTNLLAYDWEVTPPRLEAAIYNIQTLRLLFKIPQLPPPSASIQWMLQVGPKLGNAATAVALTAPDQITITRNATVGFTATEIHLLGDWLESPRFPVGLHSLLAPPDRPIRVRAGGGTP